MSFGPGLPLRRCVGARNRFIGWSASRRLLSSKTQSPKPKGRLGRGILLAGVVLGIGLAALARDEAQGNEDLVRPTSLPLFLYSHLPLNAASRVWGHFNNIELPVALRPAGYGLYSAIFGVNTDEILDKDMTHYRNLAEFFYRKIRPETRPIDPTALVNAPSDGLVLKLGIVDPEGEIEQVKGMTYKLTALLGELDSDKLASPAAKLSFLNPFDDDLGFLAHLENNTNHDVTSRATNKHSLVHMSQQGDKSLFHPSTSKVLKASKALQSPGTPTSLFYAVIYLAPGDYHRFHSPVTWVTTLRRHFVGELYSVAPYFQRSFDNLFVINERVALLGYWKYGFFSMTPVGATNVGSIKINFDKDLVTNTTFVDNNPVKKNTCYEASYEDASSLLGGHPLLKGDEVGGFMLGSTVVLVFEAPSNFKFTVDQGDYVKMGQKLGELDDSSD